MIIDFITENSLTNRDDLTAYYAPSTRGSLRYWSNILRTLREESEWKGCGHANTDTDFHLWLKETWKITVIISYAGLTSGYMTGLDVDEESYTMMLLRFPKDDS